MTGFLDNYEPVEDRLARFWTQHPTGRVFTEIVEHDEQHCIVLASVWREADDEHPAATGYAAETKTTRGVNATSMLENCETSAIGRALANCGFAPKGARPSREEMTKARRPQQDAEPVDTGGFGSREEWVATVKQLREQIAGDAELVAWVKDQQFPSPWPKAACDAIADRIAGTDPF